MVMFPIFRALAEHHKKLVYEGSFGTFSTDQRGFLPGVEGCNFNGLILAEFFKLVGEKCQSIAAIWIDFRNAFGSIDHLVIKFSMWWLNIPLWLQTATLNIYDGAQFQVKTQLDGVDHWTIPILLERKVVASVL
jgi:hypothetical protein